MFHQSLLIAILLQLEEQQEAIQVLRNADGSGGVSNFPEKSVTKV